MRNGQKARVLVLVVAYNAEATIADVLDRIPRAILKCDHEVLVMDDQSSDRTFEVASEYAKRTRDLNIRVLYNPENQGYGGNQKIGYQYALRNQFDAVVLLHGDGQYAPELMEELTKPVLDGEADAVLGSRMAKPGGALAGGMPMYKYLGNRILTFLQNRLLGTKLSEFHSGYRAYSVKALASLPLHLNTNDFHFDTEIIIQLVLAGYRIKEVPIPTHYGDEVCHVNGLAYAWHVLMTTVRAKLHQMQLCCRRQFCLPDTEPTYSRETRHALSHKMAVDEAEAGSRVLQVDFGQGWVARELEKKGCYIQRVDLSGLEWRALLANVGKANSVVNEILFSLDDFDFILLLNVIEHLDTLQLYSLLDEFRGRSRRKKPALVITTPNVAFILTRLQLLLGRFNSGCRRTHRRPRHSFLTFKSLRRVLTESGYRIDAAVGVPIRFTGTKTMNFGARILTAIHNALVFLRPSLFSDQILIRAHPLSTVAQLLSVAEDKSCERHERITQQPDHQE